MKKIFTFILLAISTLAMAQAYPGDPGHVAPSPLVYDTITIGATGVTSTSLQKSFSDKELNSGNVYAGYTAKSGSDLKVNTSSRFVNTSSNGHIRSIKVVWGTNSKNATMEIRGANSAFNNATYSGSQAPATLTYDNRTTQDEVDWTSVDYKFMHIGFSSFSQTVNVAKIIIAWEPEPSYTITPSFTYTDENGVNHNALDNPEYDMMVDGVVGAIELSHTEATAGTEVTATVYVGYCEEQDMLYEIESLMLGGVDIKDQGEFNEDDYYYTFTFEMPEEDVSIDLTMLYPIVREANEITGISDFNTISGNTATCVFTSTSGAPFDGTVEITSSNPEVVTINSASYGSFNYSAYDRGEATIVIRLGETNEWLESTAYINVTVNAQEVVLIAEDAEGKNAALKPDGGNSFIGQAVKTLDVAGDKYTTEDPETLKWIVCKHKDGNYSIEKTEGQYLSYGDNMCYTNSYSFESKWTKDANDQFVWHNMFTLSSDGTRFNTDSKTNGIKAYSTVGYAPERTLRSNLTPDAFSTVCMPYSFIAGDGLTVYTIDNKETKGDGTHIFFCPVDSGVPTEAGRPYIIQSTSTTAQAYQIGDASASAQDNHDGLYGVMSNTYWSALWDGGNSTRFYNGNVLVFKGGSLAYVEYDPVRGGGGGLAGNSACILLDEISTTSTCDDGLGGAAPRRISLAIQQPQTPTAVENILSADHINWNEPVYNVMGQRVARGTTGVLVQNGQKFIAL